MNSAAPAVIWEPCARFDAFMKTKAAKYRCDANLVFSEPYHQAAHFSEKKKKKKKVTIYCTLFYVAVQLLCRL